MIILSFTMLFTLPKTEKRIYEIGRRLVDKGNDNH